MPRSSTCTTAPRASGAKPRRTDSMAGRCHFSSALGTPLPRGRSGVTLGAMAARDLAELARVAEAASEAARPEILSRFRRVAVETKKDGTVVTEVDRAGGRAIRAVLREATPEIGILGEEYGAEGEREGRSWIVDPIDGTLAFSRGLPLFGALIALPGAGVPPPGVLAP